MAKDGVILYAQVWKPTLSSAVVLTLLSYGELSAFLVVLGVTAVALGTLVPVLHLALGIAVLLGAWMLKLVVADASAFAATLLAYHRSTEGMEPDPAWKACFEQASDEFQELKQKTADTVNEYRATATKGGPSSADAASSRIPSEATDLETQERGNSRWGAFSVTPGEPGKGCGIDS